MNKMLSAAIEYAKHGWLVLPCVPGEKRPLTKNGVYDATTDEGRIREWWAKWPQANVAVACGEKSGITVVDIDVDEQEGLDERKNLAELADTPATLIQQTPRGGYHLFYKYNSKYKNARHEPSGILIRNNGGYCLLTPSSTDRGNYEWI